MPKTYCLIFLIQKLKRLSIIYLMLLHKNSYQHTNSSYFVYCDTMPAQHIQNIQYAHDITIHIFLYIFYINALTEIVVETHLKNVQAS